MSMTNKDQVVFNSQPPVVRQMVAFVFGLVVAFTNGYSGFQLVGAIICAPLLFAGAIRLFTAAYRLAFSLLPIVLVAIVTGFSGVAAVTSFLLVPAFQRSTALGVVLTVVLMGCEVAVFIRDIRLWKNNRV